MNRTDVVKALANSGVDGAEKVVDRVIDLFTVALSAGEPIVLRSFGKLQVKQRKATMRKNPKTGADIVVPSRKTVTFEAAPLLKQRVNREH